MGQRPDPGQAVVEWPHSSVSSSAADNDLGPPLEQLLQDLNLQGTPDAVAKAQTPSTAVRGGLPVSVSIIEAGATAASKGWATAIAALGGGTAVWAAVTNFWNGQATQTRGVLVIGAAVVVAACVLGSAFIMYGDVRARGQGAAAQYHARSLIASEFLRGATAVTGMGAAPAGMLTADGAHPSSAGPGGQPSVLAEVKNAQEQVSCVNEVAQQILKETASHSIDIQIATIALALAQAGLTPMPVTLKNGGSGQGKRLIRSRDGEWKFLLDDQTWMPISEIVGFGNE